MSWVDEFHHELERYDTTSDSLAVDLRLDLAAIILKELDRKDWSQRKLADLAGYRESFVSRIVHADANCTLETVARVLWALGVRVQFQKVEPADTLTFESTTATESISYGETEEGNTDIARPISAEENENPVLARISGPQGPQDPGTGTVVQAQ